MNLEDLKLTIGDFAWFAAVIEMRANLTSKTHAARKTPQLSLYIDTKQVEIIDRLCLMTGQKVELHTNRPLTKFDRRACDVHCPTPHIHVNDEEENRKKDRPPTKRWTVSGASIVVILHSTIQYMTDPGREKFSEIMVNAAAYTPLTGQGSGMVKNSIRRLSLLGWKLPKDYLVAME